MRALPRNLLRLATLLVLVGLLVGIPIAVVATIGLPMPSWQQWRDAWSSHRVDSDFVVRLGTGIFSMLWCWFAATAVAELWSVLPVRNEMSTASIPLDRGPSGWVRGLVRFVAVSSVTASATLGSFALLAQPTHASAGTVTGVPGATDDVVTTPLGISHLVVPGDSYWRIADERLTSQLDHDPSPREVYELTRDLVDSNATRLGHRDPTLLLPGELVVVDSTSDGSSDAAAVAAVVVEPVTASSVRAAPYVLAEARPDRRPVPAAAVAAGAPAQPPDVATPDVATPLVDSVGTAASSLPYALGLGGALMIAAGTVGAVEVRRRRLLRSGVVGARLIPPTVGQARTEVLLRSINAAERIARLDVALRAAARDLADQSASVVAAVVDDAGGVHLFVRGSAVPSDSAWHADLLGGSWHLPAGVDFGHLAATARECPQPCPALVHVGAVPDNGELFVDLEAIGVLGIESPFAQPLLRGLAASLAVSPFADSMKVFSVGLGELELGDACVESLTSLHAAIEATRVFVGSTESLARDRTTFALRATSVGGETWEPVVVLACGDQMDNGSRAALLGEIRPGRGRAVVVDGSVGDDMFTLRFDGACHVLEPLGLQVVPVGLGDADVAAVEDLLASVAVPMLDVQMMSLPIEEPAHSGPAPTELVLPEWSLMVRLLGHVQVVTPAGVEATFERAKALELVAWLSQHRERPTRSTARAGLWEAEVRSATFANVVSEARRTLARAVAPPAGEEWIARTMTDELPLHDGVISDADVLALRVAAARGRAPAEAIEILRPGLELVTGLPFLGTSYLWADAEGHASSLTLLATNAATELAEHYLALGDAEGVFWATGRGLMVLNGHEALIALRMRAHADRGDLAGVRAEWASYERALALDTWSAGEPSPKLVGLRQALLSGTPQPRS